MRRPPPGLCLPVVVDSVRDADTVVVRLPRSPYKWAIRLIDVWAPELSTPQGKKAKAFVEDVLADIDQLYLWLPAPRDVESILKNLTFDRLPGHLFVSSDRTLNEMVVQAGYATKTKPEPPKASS
jgi:endonuclease YncB( thermonuclease family)